MSMGSCTRDPASPGSSTDTGRPAWAHSDGQEQSRGAAGTGGLQGLSCPARRQLDQGNPSSHSALAGACPWHHAQFCITPSSLGGFIKLEGAAKGHQELTPRRWHVVFVQPRTEAAGGQLIRAFPHLTARTCKRNRFCRRHRQDRRARPGLVSAAFHLGNRRKILHREKN